MSGWATKLAAQRAVNTKAYLVGEKGVDASRIMLYTGTTDGKTVSTTLIPAGATLDMTGMTAVDESADEGSASLGALHVVVIGAKPKRNSGYG